MRRRSFLITLFVLVLCLAGLSNAAVIGFQAESGTLGAQFDPPIVDANALGGQYITIEITGAGGSPGHEDRVATYTITFPEAGTYDLYARLYIDTAVQGAADNDSMFYGNGFGKKPATSDDDWILCNGLDNYPSDVWFWINLSEDTGLWGEAGVSFTVPAGALTQTLQVGAREDGLRMDAFVFATATETLTDEELDAAAQVTKKAISHDPDPADEATDVCRDVVLYWTPGEYAPPTSGHRIFFSDDFNDVNDGVGGIILDANSFDPPGLLDLGTTYYWRVDQASTSGGPWNPGMVWSFTIESYSIAIPGASITATADSNDVGQGPENTVNGSGLDADDLHSVELTDMWLSTSGAPQPAWIEYQFDKVYKLHQMLVWNYNGQSILTGFGLKNVTIKYSTDGTDYKTLGDTHEFAKGTGSDDYSPNAPIDFDGVPAMYVRIIANSNWGGAMYTQYGLSEVRFFYIPVRARQPIPASGAIDMDVDNVTLSWRAGREAASHDVYFSTDKQAVTSGTAQALTVSETSYDTSELYLDQTYYWKVNEVNDTETPTTWQGNVWNLTTLDFLVVDDFESYDAGDNQIWYAWIDGLGYGEQDNPPYHPGNGTGSAVGDETTDSYTEETIVHGGSQSMPYFYNNNKPDKLKYSEAEMTLSPAQDWTKYGIKALSLWFHGDPNNAAEQMYVKLNDSKVVYDGDADDIKQALWHEWNIELGDFTGVNLQNITKICIGFGDDTNPTPGGAGVVYFDDIRLYPARCLPGLLKPGADLNDDCVVDLLDVEVMANQWLSTDLLVTPQPPSTAGLVAHYEFEGTADDSVGARHGVTTGGPTYAAGKVGQAIHLDGLNDYVFIDGSFQLPVYTMAVWFRSDGGAGNRDILSAYAVGVQHGILLELQGAGTLRYLHRYPLGTGGGNNIYTTATFDDGEWHHAAIIKSETEIVLYVGGENAGSTPDSSVFDPTDAFGLAVGILDNERFTDPRYFVGAIDDIRIYNRALSHAEVAGLAGRTELFSEPFDLNIDGTVDFKDFAALAASWLDEQLWPQP